jgi:hypothetical protein
MGAVLKRSQIGELLDKIFVLLVAVKRNLRYASTDVRKSSVVCNESCFVSVYCHRILYTVGKEGAEEVTLHHLYVLASKQQKSELCPRFVKSGQLAVYLIGT